MPHKRTSSWERVRVDLEVYEYVPRDDEQDLGHDEAEREEDLIFVFEQFWDLRELRVEDAIQTICLHDEECNHLWWDKMGLNKLFWMHKRKELVGGGGRKYFRR